MFIRFSLRAACTPPQVDVVRSDCDWYLGGADLKRFKESPVFEIVAITTATPTSASWLHCAGALFPFSRSRSLRSKAYPPSTHALRRWRSLRPIANPSRSAAAWCRLQGSTSSTRSLMRRTSSRMEGKCQNSENRVLSKMNTSSFVSPTYSLRCEASYVKLCLGTLFEEERLWRGRSTHRMPASQSMALW
jgi:hypothetical protein